MQNAPRSRDRHSGYWRKGGGYISAALAKPVYPLILAIYIPVWLLSNNRGLFDSADAIRPILLTVCAVLAAFAALGFLYRDSHRAAFVAAVATACFFSFGPLREALPLTSAGSGALVILGTICLGAALLAFKTAKPWPAASKILNAFMAAMLVLPLLKVADLPLSAADPAGAAPITHRLQGTAGAERPNIIHIVVDGYSRADVLRELYRFDNSGFIGELREMGFVVPRRTTTAYSQTLMSMNAIFSMGYVNERVSALAESHTNEEMRLALNRDLEDSTLLRTLRSLGYRLVSVESLYQGVHLENFDHIISETSEKFRISYFEKELLRLTPIHRVMERLAFEDATYTQVRFALDKHDYRRFEPPFFVYNHVVAPHPPFNIAADGRTRVTAFSGMGDGSNRLKVEPSWYEQYRDGYLEKLQYTNRALLESVRHVLSAVPDPKIVILHSDHGGGMLLDRDAKSRTCVKERMSAFLAVYASNRDVVNEFPDRMNLVNLYRALLARTFGTDTPPLPAHSYYAPWDEPAALEETSHAELETFGPECSPQRYMIATHR